MAKKQEYTLEAVNQRLSEGKVKAKVFLRPGVGTLHLKATLPPKPGSDRPLPYQQVISLGLPANPDGFKRAEQEARILSGELINNEFDWSKYQKAEKLPENKPSKLWVAEFKAWYMQRHTVSEKTFVGDWMAVFKRLPHNSPLTAALMLDAVQATERNTRTRAEVCRKLQELAHFAKIDVNLLQFKGDYGPSKVRDRDIPPDSEIAYWWDQIPNPAWQWMYGVMATFGLRDHEAFFCEWTNDGLTVLKGKTGPRLVFQPLYPDWVDNWELRTIKRPPSQDIDAIYAKGKLGDKVARQFRRYGIPFNPYDLRHAYGIRASVTFELPVTTAAALMGHSPKIHLERYHKHIKLKQNQDAARRVMERSNLPTPPPPAP
jgi:integrase